MLVAPQKKKEERKTKTSIPLTAYEKIQLILSLVRTAAVVGLCIGIISLVSPLKDSLMQTVTRALETIAHVDVVVQDLQEADIPGVIAKIDALVEEGQTTISSATLAVEQTLKALDELPLDELSRSIASFSAIIQPLASLFSR